MLSLWHFLRDPPFGTSTLLFDRGWGVMVQLLSQSLKSDFFKYGTGLLFSHFQDVFAYRCSMVKTETFSIRCLFLNSLHDSFYCAAATIAMSDVWSMKQKGFNVRLSLIGCCLSFYLLLKMFWGVFLRWGELLISLCIHLSPLSVLNPIKHDCNLSVLMLV